MTGRALDVLCGAASALLATSVAASIGNYDWTPERLTALEAADREGIYGADPEPSAEPPRAAGPETLAGPRPAGEIWFEEMAVGGTDRWTSSPACSGRPGPRAASIRGPNRQSAPRGYCRACPERSPRSTPGPPSCAGVDPLLEPACQLPPAHRGLNYHRRIRSSSTRLTTGAVRRTPADTRAAHPTVWSIKHRCRPRQLRGRYAGNVGRRGLASQRHLEVVKEETMKIGEAIEQMHSGRRVARAGWNGKNQVPRAAGPRALEDDSAGHLHPDRPGRPRALATPRRPTSSSDDFSGVELRPPANWSSAALSWRW